MEAPLHELEALDASLYCASSSLQLHEHNCAAWCLIMKICIRLCSFLHGTRNML